METQKGGLMIPRSASLFSRLCLAALCLALPVTLRAQAVQGSILGSVIDPSGAGVSGAEVTIVNTGTNAEQRMNTTPSGDYRFAGLQPGFYTVTVAAPGFKKFVQTGIQLATSEARRVDASLTIGDVTATVQVEATASTLETETATLSNLKPARDYTQLPLSVFGRGWANVTLVVAGVHNKSGFIVNGARDTGNNFTSDGVSVNDTVNSRFTPNGFSGEIEMLQEVKIQTANNSAEYPQVAQFNAVSKSGTNELHGSFYWGNFNSKFQARAWHDRTKPSFTNHNMFAVTNGGPVYLPGLYNGTNKTFYFFSYGGARYRVGARQQLTVPTAELRNGDFSGLSGQVTIRDPLTGQPFPGNRIPSDRISPVARTLQDLIYPTPNQPGAGIGGLVTNYYADPGGSFDSDVWSARIDHRIGQSNMLYGRIGITQNNKDRYPGPLVGGFGEGNYYSNNPGRSLVLSDTHTFTPNLVNEFKLGYSRLFSYWYDLSYGEDLLSRLGIQGIANPGNDPAIGGMPSFTFSGGVGFHGTSTWANGNSQAQNTYQLVDNVSWFQGRHNIKFGVDVRHMQVNDSSKPQSMRGAYTFEDRFTGFAYADFLLGYPSSATRAIPRPNAYPRSNYYGLYFQDDFKLHQRVTLNYGVRYEYQTPWTEKYDRMFTFLPGEGAIATAGDTMPADLVPQTILNQKVIPAASAGLPRSLYRADRNNLAPRIGIAIRPLGDTSTVVRFGYGVYYQMWPGLVALQSTGGPWQSVQTFVVEGTTPTIQFPNPFNAGSRFSTLSSIGGLDPDFPNERTQQWNASLGRTVWKTAVEIGYIGTKVSSIPYNENLNLLPPSTTPYSLSRVPFPSLSVNLARTGGSSIYHGMTVQANRTMARGASFNINYTWAKSLSDVDLRSAISGIQQNQYERSLERADVPQVRRHMLRASYVWELPFGKGKIGGGNAFVSKLVGGWQLSGITSFYTGARLTPTFSGRDPANTNQFSGRPDRIADGNIDYSRDTIRNRQPIFDRAAFVVPASGRGSYGNSARFVLTGPGEATWNAVMARNFEIRERARLQFRWEMFNAFNRANFNNPNLNITSGAFGVVTSAQSGRSMLFGLRLDY
jgi:hypothetical protein